ncbi:MAG: FAD-dependent thymidylate synthase [Clostridiales bacterium]|nr:FAD-dependent thymidylate synthase [Clostridiales bacterium]
MQNVKLIAHTPDPESVVAAAARLCYSAVGVDALLEAQTPEKNAKFVKMLASMGHESPIEHVSFTFAVEGVSRSLLAQITRHRIASFSVQSQRYVRLDDFQFVVPPEIEADPASKELFLEAMKKQGEEYLALAASLQARHKAELMAQGMDEKTANQKAEKMANEDARFVLPNACETKLVMTMNARSLLNFFKLRCCNRAQWEIRALAEKMFQLVYPVAPAIFAAAGPSCVACGHCTEGKMSCGKQKEVQAKYAAWKESL